MCVAEHLASIHRTLNSIPSTAPAYCSKPTPLVGISIPPHSLSISSLGYIKQASGMNFFHKHFSQQIFKAVFGKSVSFTVVPKAQQFFCARTGALAWLDSSLI